MAKNPGTANNESSSELTVDPVIRRNEIRQALLRLRDLGEKLPPVDVVAVIREGRETTSGNDQ